MTVHLIDDLHLARDPEQRLAEHVAAEQRAIGELRRDPDDTRLIVRCPDRGTTALHALRANDIARMLQRHARIHDINVTPAGTIVASATLCRRRGTVAIWTGYAIGDWHPSDIVQRGLGGSETAAVRLAEELAAMGFQVTLYGQFEQEGLYGDVILRDFRQVDWTEPVDALLIFRQAWMLDQRPTAGWVGLWLEDLPGLEGITQARMRNLDRICCVSHWHKQATEEHYPFLAGMKSPQGHDLVAACRNGVNLAWFDGTGHDEAPEREQRVVYSSSPDRGGDILLEVWPQIRERVPDAELILTYSRWYDLCAAAYTERTGHLKMLELVDQPGVQRVPGGLGQMALANLMRSSLVWTHPAWYTDGDQQFHETSCISAMEAQAAGCVVVASNWGALTETVQHGTLIDGDPREEDGAWRAAFVDAIVAGLTDPIVQETAQTVGPELVDNMGWRGAAEQLVSFLPETATRYR